VNPSYRLGIWIVAGTILLSAVAILAAESFGRPETPTPAGQELGDAGYELGPFRLTERSGREVTDADLAEDVWVAAFIFTRCPTSCPRISAIMKGLQGPMGDAGARLVSISVDPEHDRPPVLADYARGLGADPDRWWFLTGNQEEVYRLILDRFHISVAKTDEEDRKKGAEAVSHSDRLVLVDRGNKVIGSFRSGEPDAVRALVSKARRKASWARRLPTVNAALNGTCALLLLVGWSMILSGRVRAHAACMIAAVAVSAIFLAGYLTYHFQAGSVTFPGVGGAKFAYRTILLSHTVLATLGVVPLVALTLARAIRSEFHRHASIARVTFPIWVYVSVTGVVIYWMLYQMPVYTS